MINELFHKLNIIFKSTVTSKRLTEALNYLGELRR